MGRVSVNGSKLTNKQRRWMAKIKAQQAITYDVLREARIPGNVNLRIIQRLRIIGFSNIIDFVDVINGRVILKDLDDVPEEKLGAIKSLVVKYDRLHISLFEKTWALSRLLQIGINGK